MARRGAAALRAGIPLGPATLQRRGRSRVPAGPGAAGAAGRAAGGWVPARGRAAGAGGAGRSTTSRGGARRQRLSLARRGPGRRGGLWWLRCVNRGIGRRLGGITAVIAAGRGTVLTRNGPGLWGSASALGRGADLGAGGDVRAGLDASAGWCPVPRCRSPGASPVPTVAPRCPACSTGGSAEQRPARGEAASAKGCLENSFLKGLLPSLADYIFREQAYSERYRGVLQQRLRFKPGSPLLAPRTDARPGAVAPGSGRAPTLQRPPCSHGGGQVLKPQNTCFPFFFFFFNILKTLTLILALQSRFSHNSCNLGLHCLAMLFL